MNSVELADLGVGRCRRRRGGEPLVKEKGLEMADHLFQLW